MYVRTRCLYRHRVRIWRCASQARTRAQTHTRTRREARKTELRKEIAPNYNETYLLYFMVHFLHLTVFLHTHFKRQPCEQFWIEVKPRATISGLHVLQGSSVHGVSYGRGKFWLVAYINKLGQSGAIWLFC